MLASRGATITFTNSNGALLIAFLALFVTTVGSSFWRLVCFVTHTNLSTRTDQDAIYHQRQAILRNADTSLVGVQHLLRLAWSWRRKSHSMWLRLGPLIGISILLTIGFYVASIFSSQVSSRRGSNGFRIDAHITFLKLQPESKATYVVSFLSWSILNARYLQMALRCVKSNTYPALVPEVLRADGYRSPQ